MPLTVSQKADALGTYRFVFVHLMETLATWVPTSPELEVKTLFGRHIWTCAQHADLAGRRTVELRAKLHYERPPEAGYRAALEQVRAESSSGNRMAAFYDVLLTDLDARLRLYLADTDDLVDAPTVDVLRRVLSDFERMRQDREDCSRERPDVVATAAAPLEKLVHAFASCPQLVVYRESAS